MSNPPIQLGDLQSCSDVGEFLGISDRQLRYLLYGPGSTRLYRKLEIPKRRGGTRTLLIPRRELKYVQRRLAAKLAEIYRPRRPVHGFVNDKSIVSNAAVHSPTGYVFNIDLKNFFPSINFGRVRGLFLSDPISLSSSAATIWAQICCFENEIPQGAPTSPIISNMICARLDGMLTRLAHRHDCLFTRYADDITFSRRRSPFPPEIGYEDQAGAHAGEELAAIVRSNGFRINRDKVHLQTNRKRQRVTGLVVNKRPNVPRRFIRQIRAMIHAWRVYGEEAANRHHGMQYYRRTGKPGTPEIRSVIRGKLDFLKMVKGPTDPVYKNLQRQFVNVHPAYLRVMKKENSKMVARDFFISHASEDKDAIARPLADALIARGHSVWFDEYELRLGDSLLGKINEGLANSEYGIVILSDHFFGKNWPQKELDGLTALENADGKKRVLPLWHNISFEEVAKRSPILAGLLAAETATVPLTDIVTQIEGAAASV